MNEVKTLKIALVVVIIAAGVVTGYSVYRQKQLERSVNTFAYNISMSDTELQAAQATATFLKEADKGLVPASADAGFGWLKRLFGGGGSGSAGDIPTGSNGSDGSGGSHPYSGSPSSGTPGGPIEN